MFGLLELSRQRLRSSIVDRSFEKCPYCNGSGIILNNNSITEQIIKVIKEKISKEDNLHIEVKCNSSLAESLINKKREEINELELTHNCKILFVFDNHFSLHEPIINVIDQKIIKVKPIKKQSQDEKPLKKKSTKKKTIAKKKEIKIKPRKKKVKEVVEKIDDKKLDKELPDEKNILSEPIKKKIKIKSRKKKTKVIIDKKDDNNIEKKISTTEDKENPAEMKDKSGWWQE